MAAAASSAARAQVEGAGIAVIGEPVCGPEFLKGYSTFLDTNSNAIVAATCGVVEVVERVVSVRGLNPRYMAEVGDIVVGRIAEVSGNRWKVAIGAQADSIMLLSNVTEPGGVLRRRGREDELTMRRIFSEGDIVVAEVQRLMTDGTISLHTRSAGKFGKMNSAGCLITVTPCLVRRVPKHFHVYAALGVFMVLGHNGRIWLTAATQAQIDDALAVANDNGTEAVANLDGGEFNPAPAAAKDGEAEEATNSTEDDGRVRQGIARVSNCIRVMNKLKLPIYPVAIAAVVEATVESQLSPQQILRPSSEQMISNAVALAKENTQRKRGRD